MAALFINNWLKRSDADFYTLFIKSWIPYNAWYMNEYYDELLNRTSDRAIIDYIKDNSNKYKDTIVNLLKGADNSSKFFKLCLSNLNKELNAHTVPNENDKISFSTINICRNTVNQFVHNYRHYTYKVTFNYNALRNTKRYIYQIFNTKTTASVYWEDFYSPTIQELERSVTFQELNLEKQEQLKKIIIEVNPAKPVEILAIPNRNGTGNIISPSRYLVIDEINDLYFVNNPELVSKVIIELLYRLRCLLFHGEVDPTDGNQPIFEQAYLIQKMLIKELEQV